MNIASNVAVNIEQFLYQSIGSPWSFTTGSSTNSNLIIIQYELGEVSPCLIESNYIYDLDNDNYIVGEKILVKIEKDENNEIVSDIPEIELYSFGKTEEESLKQLKLDIIELFDDLINTPDNKLGSSPIKWKIFLKKHIVKKQ